MPTYILSTKRTNYLVYAGDLDRAITKLRDDARLKVTHSSPDIGENVEVAKLWRDLRTVGDNLIYHPVKL